MSKCNVKLCDDFNTVGPLTALIFGTRKISVFPKQCIVGYYIGTSKNRVSAKFLHIFYTIKSVYIEFLELIKNRVSAKSVLKEAVYNEALLYSMLLLHISSNFSLKYSKASLHTASLSTIFIDTRFLIGSKNSMYTDFIV